MVHLTLSDLITNDANRLEQGLSLPMRRLTRHWRDWSVPWGADGLAPEPGPGDIPALAFADILEGLHMCFGV